MSKEEISGFKVLLLGESGSGKTHCLTTLLKAGLEVFILFTELGKATLLKVLKEDKSLTEEDRARLHYTYLAQTTQSWAAMAEMSKKINTLSFEAISKSIDPNRREYQQFLEIYSICHNFPCERTGKKYGDVSDWNADRVFIIDSLSGLNSMSMDLVVGGRPTRSQADWQVAQNNLGNLLKKLCTDLRCHFVLTGHLQKEKNEVTGAIELMPNTLGRAPAPKLPQNFDEVVMVKKVSTEFSWSTAEHNAALKNRLLPLNSKLQPSFVPLLKAWQDTGGVIQKTETA